MIDDAHRLADPAAFTFLDALLDRLPQHWTVLLAAHEDPPLALHRLRALAELAEIRTAALAFSPAEAKALAGARGSPVSPADLQQLQSRTLGWPAALSLALQETTKSGLPLSRPHRDRMLHDYLRSEVLDELPANLRRFMLRCSVLPTLTPSRCQTLCAEGDATALLDNLEQRGLLTPTTSGHSLQPEPEAQFPHILREALLACLPCELPEEWAMLQQHAARLATTTPITGTTAASITTAPIAAPRNAPTETPEPSQVQRPPAPSSITRAASPPVTLSAREREVLARIAAGDSNKLIARAFDLSPHTVKRHVANILDKLVLSSRGQAAAWHRANGVEQRELARCLAACGATSTAGAKAEVAGWRDG